MNCNILAWSFNTLADLDWIEIINAFAAVAMAIIAALALNTWRKQDKSKREAEFLDTLIEATHAYIGEMAGPVTLVEMELIAMKSRMPSAGHDRELRGAIAYIIERGQNASKRLTETLTTAQSSSARLRSLAAKGQVFRLDDYAKCQNAVEMLTRQVDRIEALTVVLGSPTWNWENPEVLRLLKSVMEIQPDDVRRTLSDNNVAIIQFATEAYKRLYGRASH